MKNFTDVLQCKTLFNRCTNPYPCYISLAYMHYTLGIIYKVVYLPFKYRFKVRLHLSSCYLNINTQGQAVSLFGIPDIWSYEFYFSILYLIHLCHLTEFGCLCLSSAHFKVKVVLTYTFTFKCRTVSHGYVYFGNGYLKAPDFDGF